VLSGCESLAIRHLRCYHSLFSKTDHIYRKEEAITVYSIVLITLTPMIANSRAFQRNDCKVNIHVIVLVLHYASPHQYSYVREVKVNSTHS
jgi:hypothetical protein